MYVWTSLVAQTVKRLHTMRETRVQSLGREHLLEKEMATHCSALAWKIPWTEEPGRLQSMGSQRVTHDWVTSLTVVRLDNKRPFFWHILKSYWIFIYVHVVFCWVMIVKELSSRHSLWSGGSYWQMKTWPRYLPFTLPSLSSFLLPPFLSFSLGTSFPSRYIGHDIYVFTQILYCHNLHRICYQYTCRCLW